MTKTEKRLDGTLRKALTLACENIKYRYSYFNHLTHEVNLKRPENTLRVTCYFVDELALSDADSQQSLALIESEINQQLNVLAIKPQTISFLSL